MKWLLLIPHVVVLAFLWVAFWVLTVIAFFAILFTGRYPRGIFDFNLGVLRWTWRVAFYGYSALGTDRYPPFSLDEVPDYPARLDIAYPERLSRGLVLVKWWLLALPHYVVIGFFLGAGSAFAISSGATDSVSIASGGLVGVLVFFAGVVLLFRNRYPAGIFDAVLGMDRWVARVVAYATLMTDVYPPFRLDQGGADPAVADHRAVGEHDRRQDFSAGRTITAVIGGLVVLVGLALASTGAAGLVADATARSPQGFLETAPVRMSTPGHALRTENLALQGTATDGTSQALNGVFGPVELRAGTSDGRPAFVGIGPTAAVNRYLDGVGQGVVLTGTGGGVAVSDRAGTGPRTPPTGQTFWVASAVGPGEPALTWQPAVGDWTAVVMNADGSAPLTARATVGAVAPALFAVSVGMLVVGLVVLAGGIVLVVVAARRRPVAPGPSTPVGPRVPTTV